MPYLTLAQHIADRFGRYPDVEAVTLAGSCLNGSVDAHADLDIIVYHYAGLPRKYRYEVAAERGKAIHLDNHFLEAEDQWTDIQEQIQVDVIYRSLSFADQQLADTLERHNASLGNSTTFWHTVREARMLYDKTDWFSQLKRRADVPYPDRLQRNIINKNHHVLRNHHNSYYSQLRHAVSRKDLISVNRCVAALLASTFDILFALNKQTHPGNKQLVEAVVSRCALYPEDLGQLVESIVRAETTSKSIFGHLDRLLDALDAILQQEGLFPLSPIA